MLKDEDLQRELGRSSPGQDSYVGARDEIQRRAAVKRERLMRWALGLAGLSLLASLAIALGLISVRQQLATLREAGSPAFAEGSEQPGQAPAGASAQSGRPTVSSGATAQTPNAPGVSNAPGGGAEGARSEPAEGAAPRQRGGGKAATKSGQGVTPMERGERALGSAPASAREPRIAACQRFCPRSAKAGPKLPGDVTAKA